MHFLPNVAAGWLAVPFIILVAIAYMAIVSWVLSKSQATKLTHHDELKTAA